MTGDGFPSKWYHLNKLAIIWIIIPIDGGI